MWQVQFSLEYLSMSGLLIILWLLCSFSWLRNRDLSREQCENFGLTVQQIIHSKYCIGQTGVSCINSLCTCWRQSFYLIGSNSGFRPSFYSSFNQMSFAVFLGIPFLHFRKYTEIYLLAFISNKNRMHRLSLSWYPTVPYKICMTFHHLLF